MLALQGVAIPFQRRLIADAKQAALAFCDDFEAHRRLVETGVTELEVAQCRPLRLADGLAGRLDRHVAGQRRPAFFFLRTFRGGCCERAGAGFGPSGCDFAPFPPPSPSSESAALGGVRELFFSSTPTGVFGTSLRVINPCPTVHRFVVTQ